MAHCHKGRATANSARPAAEMAEATTNTGLRPTTSARPPVGSSHSATTVAYRANSPPTVASECPRASSSSTMTLTHRPFGSHRRALRSM